MRVQTAEDEPYLARSIRADTEEADAEGPAAERNTRTRRAINSLSHPGPWRRGLILAALALLLALLMLLHAQIPNTAGLGSLVDTALPWFGLLIPVLLAGALLRRSASALLAVLLPSVVWLSLFGGLLGDKSQSVGDLTVAGHNVGAENTDPAGTARALAASGADLLALQEMTPQATAIYTRELATAYPHHAVRGTVGLWSKLPLSNTRQVNVVRGNAGPLAATRATDDSEGTPRALRTTVTTNKGPLAVYVAHLGSVRVTPRTGFWTDSRDFGATALGKAVAAERNKRMVVLGDLNGTTDDRALNGLTSRLRSAQEAAGDGFGFTWPAAFPMARIDQILTKGVDPKSSWVLPATTSDHLPVAANISW